jgi:tRNA-uridine 2-sulfurtransferase
MRVVVGMSGGVDSSVAALLLRDAGHEVTGVTMSIYSGEPAAEGARPPSDSCYGPGEARDIEDAAAVCAHLGIRHAVVDLRAEYRALVLDYARAEYQAGRTPNPCVLCNQRLKFGLMLSRLSAQEGASWDRLATGHYCRVVQAPDTGRWAIRRGADDAKDQSYFLCMLSQDQLSRLLFPLGGLEKPRVREIARAAGLPVHDRTESQDFAAGGYRAVLALPEHDGPIVDAEGREVGRHRGVWGFTVGQRRGLGVGGAGPLYVTGMDAQTNTVSVGPDAALFGSACTARAVNWAAVAEPSGPVRLAVKIRYRNPAAPATVHPLPGGDARVVFDEPQRAIARGQWAVFYDGDILVGGGVIQ